MHRRKFLSFLGMGGVAASAPLNLAASASFPAIAKPAVDPYVLNKFYKVCDWFTAADAKTFHFSLPLHLVNRVMLEKYPEWFHPDRMMYSPTDMFFNGRHRICEAVKSRALNTSLPADTPCLKESIQDSRVFDRLLGYDLVKLVYDATDELNTEWLKLKNEGWEVCPYIPLMLTSFYKTRKPYTWVLEASFGFKTRFATFKMAV